MDSIKELTLNVENNFCDTIFHMINKYFKEWKIYDGKYSNFDRNAPYLFFRGQSNYDWNLEPSINRANNDEFFILNNFRKSNLNLTISEVIPKAQHYGNPTRALDFTSNLKIALFFSCFDLDLNAINNVDGALYVCLYYPHLNYWISSTTINFIALMNLEYINMKDLAIKLLERNEYKEKIHKNVSNINELCADIASYLFSGFMVIFDYKLGHLNNRIVKQEGALFYCGCSFFSNEKQCATIKCCTNTAPYYNVKVHKINNPSWMENTCLKIKIPKNLKNRVLEEIAISRENLDL